MAEIYVCIHSPTSSSITHQAGFGNLCGDRVKSDEPPTAACGQGHHPSWWRCGVTLWRCVGCELNTYTTTGMPPTSLCPDCGGGWVDCGDRQEHDERTGTTRHTTSLAPVTSDVDVAAPSAAEAPSSPPATRKRLPFERRSLTRTFRLKYRHKDGTPDEMHLYFIAGVYADGRLGEIFITVDRMGSFARGALDAAATLASILLQHGVPLSTITTKLRHTRYEPAGFTGDPEFPSCTSPLDLLAQWLDRRFGASP